MAAWDAWKSAPRTELLPIAWAAGAVPDDHGSLGQPQLVYRSDVGGRLKAILARPAPKPTPTPTLMTEGTA